MIAASAYTPESARVRRVVREIQDTYTFTLDVAGRANGFAFAPGQFNMLYVFGVGEVAISISGDPGRPEALVHTVRAVGRVTRPLCALRRSAVVGVRGPYGVPWPTELGLGKDIVFVAGGLGLAPLRPAILHVLAHRMAYKRVHVLYGARSPAEILYSRDLERWRGRLDVSLDVTVDRADSTWFGHVGVVTALVARAEIDPAATVAFVCGPEVMMRATVRALVQRGVPVEATYLSMERNMKCAVGICGHCQLGGAFVCKDGPVFRADRILPAMATRER